MKADPTTRCRVRLRDLLLRVLLTAFLGLDIYVGAFLAAHLDQARGLPTNLPAASNMNFGDLLIAAR